MLRRLPKNLIPILTILLVVLMLFFANYSPGTWLSGWDNLHTEFHPGINISRGLNSVWQGNQSFGNVAGMAFPTALFHALFSGFLSMFFVPSLVRYVSIFLLIYLGALGIYYLLKYLGFEENREIFAYVGAFFYILNFGHIQIINVPTESFIGFLGLLPWEILVFLKVLHSRSKEQLFLYSGIFLLINIFGSFQFLTQTVFLVYILTLGAFVADYLIEHRSRKAIKRAGYSILLAFVAGIFWILPQVYFLASSLDVVSGSKINQIATQNVIAQSSGRGTIEDLARFIGIYYDLYDAQGDLIFKSWQEHFSSPGVLVAQFVIFGLILAGIFVRKFKHSTAFLLLFLLSAGAMLFQPFGDVALLGQIFRSPFTKFVTVYSLASAYFLAVGLDLLSRLKLNKVLVGSVCLLIIVYIALPSLEGNYISPLVRVRYPARYFDLMGYLRREVEPTARVALFPDVSFWGWFRYNWGYEGSGFIWYGVPQTIVSRTFDVWSFSSESFFWESKHALESRDNELLNKVLSKYQVDYIVFDPSILPDATLGRGAALGSLEGVLRVNPALELYEDFGNLRIYRVRQDVKETADISVFGEVPSVGPQYTVTDQDFAYLDLGTYSTSRDKPTEYNYPLIDFMTQTEVAGKEWEINEAEETFDVSVPVGHLPEDQYSLTLPDNSLLTTRIFLGEVIETHEMQVSVVRDGDTLKVTVPKKEVVTYVPSEDQVNNCGGRGDISTVQSAGTLEVESSGWAIGCFGHEVPLLAHWAGYLASVETENLSGNDLFFYILGSKNNRFSKLETLLGTGTHYFVLNPGYFFDDGYIFSFLNQSFGRDSVKNKVGSLKVYVFPVEYLKSIRFERVGSDAGSEEAPPGFVARKISSYRYQVDGNFSGSSLALWQSYDPGWVAFCGFWFCKADHVSINNWANGWLFEEVETKRVRLVFWPQYLEFIGLFLSGGAVIGCFALLLREKRRDPDA